MTTYYAFLWVVGLLNVLRCLAYIGQVEASKPLLLNLLWLLTRFGAPALFLFGHDLLAICMPAAGSRMPLCQRVPAVGMCACRGRACAKEGWLLMLISCCCCRHAGLVMLEVSVVVFLLQGYLISGREVG